MVNYVGYRYWKVVRDESGVHLHSMYYTLEWLPNEVARATHKNPRGPIDLHASPARDCECGIYVFRDCATAIGGNFGGGAIHRRRGETSGNVLGAVLTGGRVVFHGDQGLRAAQALPLAFAIPDDEDSDPLVTEVARVFNVAVVRYRYLESYVREFGERIRSAA